MVYKYLEIQNGKRSLVGRPWGGAIPQHYSLNYEKYCFKSVEHQRTSVSSDHLMELKEAEKSRLLCWIKVPEPELDTTVTGDLTLQEISPSCCKADILPFSNYLKQPEATDPLVAHVISWECFSSMTWHIESEYFVLERTSAVSRDI